MAGHAEKRVSLLERYYALLLSVLFLLGLGLILYAAWSRHHVSEETNATVLEQIHRAAPAVSGIESSRSLAVLRTWQERLVHESLWQVVLRDIGIALVVAVLLTLVIENYARNRLQDEVRSGVVEAAFQRLIPAAVFQQVRQHVIGAHVLKEDWSIEMILRRAPNSSTSGQYHSRTVLRYYLRSLLGRPSLEPFGVELDRDVTGVDEHENSLPRFVSITVGKTQYVGDSMVPHLSEEGLCFNLSEIEIGAHPLEIVVVLEEVVRVPDTFVWSTRHCTSGSTVSIDTSNTPEIQFKVSALHPDMRALHESVSGSKWDFSEGMLPYQGFEVLSRRAAGKPLTPSSPASAHA